MSKAKRQEEWSHPLAGTTPKTICTECQHSFRHPVVNYVRRNSWVSDGDMFVEDNALWRWLCGAFGDEMYAEGDRDWISPVTGKHYVTLTPECRVVNTGDCPHFEAIQPATP